MTKIGLIEDIYDQIGMTKHDVAKIVDEVFERMRECIIETESVKISGFGNFSVKERGKRVGRNPKTGDETVIPPRKVLAFRPSLMLKDKINGK